MDKRFRNARYHVTFVKVRVRMIAYRRGRNRLNKDRSDDELTEFDGAKVLLDSVSAQVVKFEKN